MILELLVWQDCEWCGSAVVWPQECTHCDHPSDPRSYENMEVERWLVERATG